ncbi:MAG: glutathione S-transferase family protein, partial [Devosia sp.]|nr:glutathione S-transferase family protein [Devosia sp.]
MKLLIGNRNYSTWSLRPWLVLTHFEIPFEDEVLQLSGKGFRDVLARRSPTGRVPVLIDGDLVVPETIAIIEYLADRFPDKGIWPDDIKDRALARAAAAEMHAGF